MKISHSKVQIIFTFLSLENNFKLCIKLSKAPNKIMKIKTPIKLKFFNFPRNISESSQAVSSCTFHSEFIFAKNRFISTLFSSTQVTTAGMKNDFVVSHSCTAMFLHPRKNIFRRRANMRSRTYRNNSRKSRRQ